MSVSGPARCVAGISNVVKLKSLNANRGGHMKPTDLIVLLAAVNNGYALTAFVVALAVWVYFNRGGAP